MKKIIATLFLLVLILMGCQTMHQETTNEMMMSNMSDEKSREEVKLALSKYLATKNVDKFIQAVTDYNHTIENNSLNKGFEQFKEPSYDMAKISELWGNKKSDFIGYNCRITTFMLLKDNINIQKGTIDDTMLFLDKDAIQIGQLFEATDINNFKQLFSRVKTEATTDISVHAEKMKKHFSNIKFDDKAKMISVVLHDNLDGDYLFIGHVGVLVEDKGKYIFVEKLSFEEPFQAIKFNSKEECYQYLSEKYKAYTTENTAAPFIMENDKWIKM